MMKKLPLNYNFLKPEIIKKLIEAHKALAELNWLSQKIPNQNILINSLSLQEAKDSSGIENIITTHDELYKAQIDKSFISAQTKEVVNYKDALLYWFNLVKNDKLLLNRDILKIQEILEGNDAGFRTQAGTKLKNDQTWETVYTPPQNIEEIKDLMWKTKKSMKEKVSKIYSKDLLEIIFSHPYTKIEFLVDRMWMTRQRVSRYLQELVDNWYMIVFQIKNSKYFIHIELFELLKKWL